VIKKRFTVKVKWARSGQRQGSEVVFESTKRGMGLERAP
jgi:hypothetical protein